MENKNTKEDLIPAFSIDKIKLLFGVSNKVVVSHNDILNLNLYSCLNAAIVGDECTEMFGMLPEVVKEKLQMIGFVVTDTTTGYTISGWNNE